MRNYSGDFVCAKWMSKRHRNSWLNDYCITSYCQMALSEIRCFCDFLLKQNEYQNVSKNCCLTPLELHHKNDCNYIMSEISCFRGVFAIAKLMSVHQQNTCFAKLQMRTNIVSKPTLSQMRWLCSLLVLVKHQLNTNAIRAKRWRNRTW